MRGFNDIVDPMEKSLVFELLLQKIRWRHVLNYPLDP